MSKAGLGLLRTTLFRAADHARKQDPQLAKIYHTQIVERGADHRKALCVVASHLAERAWTVMNRAMHYVICDNEGTPITPETAEQLIAEQWTVPAQIRARRRSTKTPAGKAPQQVLAGHIRSDAKGVDKRGSLPRQRSSADRRSHVKPSALTADRRQGITRSRQSPTPTSMAAADSSGIGHSSGDRCARRAPPFAATSRCPKTNGRVDFAIRRGHRCATILVDIHTHRSIDAHLDWNVEKFPARLHEHLGAAIICRDRSPSAQTRHQL